MEGLGGDGGGKLRSALRTQADGGTTYEHTTCAQRDALRVALRVRGGIEMAKERNSWRGWVGTVGGSCVLYCEQRRIAETRTIT